MAYSYKELGTQIPTRSEVVLDLDNSLVIKTPGAREIKDIQLVAAALAPESSFSIPEFLIEDGKIKSQLIPEFEMTHISQYFGKDRASLNPMDKALQAVADIRCLPIDHKELATPDTDEFEGLMEFLSKVCVIGSNRKFAVVHELLARSQYVIPMLELHPAHGDFIPANWVASQDNLYVIDWDTFGMYYKGWDEARLYTHTFDNESGRGIVESFVGENFDLLEQIYFWRSVLVRSYVLYSRLVSGKFDNYIHNGVKLELLGYFESIFAQAKDKLTLKLVEQ